MHLSILSFFFVAGKKLVVKSDLTFLKVKYMLKWFVCPLLILAFVCLVPL